MSDCRLAAIHCNPTRQASGLLPKRLGAELPPGRLAPGFVAGGTAAPLLPRPGSWSQCAQIMAWGLSMKRSRNPAPVHGKSWAARFLTMTVGKGKVGHLESCQSHDARWLLD